MQFPESWLRTFCDPPLSSRQLADVLTLSGFEVEAMRTVAPAFGGVVVAEIVEAVPHPQADRLRVCQVDAGAAGRLQIVCGAANARAGLRAPLALVGARLPAADGTQPAPPAIGIGLLRGVESHGMLCSARELGIADDHAGLLELTPDATIGADVRDWLHLDDTLFTLKLTPNLGHGLSVFGVAREVAALTGAPLTPLQIAPVPPVHDQRLPVDVQASDLCGRFSGRVVRNVDTQAATPAWMVERLARCGQRSIGALVDISNYVMFELGRPSHIFDLDKIAERLVVRWGRAGETLKLLDGSTAELDAQIGVIADSHGVESLAGIMGGDATAVSPSTRNVYLEAAFWWPDAVAGRSRRLGFSTDAGHRFERGVDPASTVQHLERITQLVLAVCGGEPGPVDDQVLRLPEPVPVTLRVARTARVIGMPLQQPDCADALRRLGLPFTEGDGTLTVTPPSWRFDLRIEEDLIEEVVRMIGVDRLPATPTLAPVQPMPAPETRRGATAVRHMLSGLGYQETISFSFVEERWERELAGNSQPIRVLNPIAAPLSVMRSSLIGSLVAALRLNQARRATRLRLFEVGRVFRRDAAATDGPLGVARVDQPMRVAGIAWGPDDPPQWGRRTRDVDFFDVKGDLEALLGPRRADFVPALHPALHPGRCAQVLLDGQAIGTVGELHPRWRQGYELPQAPILFELDLAPLLERRLPVFEPLPRRQSAWRDVALVAGEHVTHDVLVRCLADGGSDPLIRDATLFDQFRPPADAAGFALGERSLAVRLELRDDRATLTDERIDAAVAVAVARAEASLGVRLRR